MLNKNHRNKLSTERVRALTDGVVAVAMTLLILDIKIPELAANVSSMHLWVALKSNFTGIFAYLLSFYLIARYWRLNAFVLRDIEFTNFKLLGINILFLFFITFLPFSTNLMDHYTNQLAVIIFDLNIVFPALLMVWMVCYIYHWHAKENNIEFDDETHAFVKRFIRSLCVTPLIGAISIALSFFDLTWALMAWVLLAFHFQIVKKRVLDS